MGLLLNFFSYSFLQRALIAGIAICLAAALVGAVVVLKKNSMLGDGLSHAAFGAFAVATVLGFSPLWFALPVVILSSFLVLHLKKIKGLSGDASIALLSASSLAIGTIAISVSKGVNVDLNSYLFGSILSVSWADVWLSAITALATVAFYLLFFRQIFAVTFDEEFAHSMGLKTRSFSAIFAIICSVVVVLGMRLLGALLISSLIVFPTVISAKLFGSFKKVVIFSCVISVVNFVVGLLASYVFSIPTGATVVIVNLFVLLIVDMLKR
ncbi:metal ABC transporter permease [Candidatus Saccharibacteria bacterium]|nr:metal ABC transporter permease [Candidatus Saccharibacteria bacterium]